MSACSALKKTFTIYPTVLESWENATRSGLWVWGPHCLLAQCNNERNNTCSMGHKKPAPWDFLLGIFDILSKAASCLNWPSASQNNMYCVHSWGCSPLQRRRILAGESNVIIDETLQTYIGIWAYLVATSVVFVLPQVLNLQKSRCGHW